MYNERAEAELPALLRFSALGRTTKLHPEMSCRKEWAVSRAATVPTSEMAILRRVFEAEEPFQSADAARAILRFRFSAQDRTRMNRLAARNRQGKLNPEEQEELDNFIRVGQTLGILQSKARRSLKVHGCESGDE